MEKNPSQSTEENACKWLSGQARQENRIIRSFTGILQMTCDLFVVNDVY